VVDEQAQLVTLDNGSEIRSVPASERAVRGWSVDLLLADEAALTPDDLLLGAALPTTAARPDARVVLASSANLASGSYFDFAMKGEQGDEHIRTFRMGPEGRYEATEIDAASREEIREVILRAPSKPFHPPLTDALSPDGMGRETDGPHHRDAENGLDRCRTPEKKAPEGLLHRQEQKGLM